jgi:type II secretory pathway component GspD/PulD (secretin)
MKMKNLALMVLAALAAGVLAAAAQTDGSVPDTNSPSTNEPAASTNADQSAAPATPAPPTTNATNAPDTNALAIVETNDVEDMTVTNAVRMNFHNAPLNTVLNYLSRRMGFAINSQVDVRGTATIVSEQPISTNEVIELLSGALSKNGYNVSRNGIILTITSATGSMTAPGTPVHQVDRPDQIPVNDEIATYILSVHTLNPTQLIKDLAELIPPDARVAANEAGNAVIMTARQRDIHRFSEILNALDGTSVAQVDVFVLNYADAKSVAAELKEVFQSPDSTVSRADARTRFRGGGGGGFGGFPGFGGAGGGGDNSSDSKNAANKAVFTSDDQMNAVIASAPPDYFTSISNIIDKLDHPSQEVTVMKLFHLKFADPQETADELSNLFPDPTSQNNQNNRSAGMRFVPPWMQQQQSAGSEKSQRMTIQTLVRAVPDPRTGSLLVTASKEQMEQIAGLISEMDNNPAQRKGVYTYDLNAADPITVQNALTALFAGSSYKAQSSTSTADPLTSRAQGNAQQQSSSSTTTGFGSTGAGTTASH